MYPGSPGSRLPPYEDELVVTLEELGPYGPGVTRCHRSSSRRPTGAQTPLPLDAVGTGGEA